MEEVDETNDTRSESWNTIVSDLIEHFDGNNSMFEEVKNLSNYQLQLGPITLHLKNGRQYFDVLENNLDSDDLLDFLINLMDYSNFHQDLYFGEGKIADILKQHKETLWRYKRKCMRMNIYDENFVGREEEIDKLLKILTNSESQYLGNINSITDVTCIALLLYKLYHKICHRNVFILNLSNK